jgi:hypothetical protein
VLFLSSSIAVAVAVVSCCGCGCCDSDDTAGCFSFPLAGPLLPWSFAQTSRMDRFSRVDFLTIRTSSDSGTCVYDRYPINNV